jgi:hypothetical protein
MWPQDPVGAYNLDESLPYPIPLTNVLDVGERCLPAMAEQGRKAIYIIGCNITGWPSHDIERLG